MQNDGKSATQHSSGEEAGRGGIRRLTYADLPAALAIERKSFPTPWSLAMFLSELSRPQSVCLCVEHEGELAGYLICSRYDREWHLADIAVDPALRRRGFGTALIAALLDVIGDDQQVTLEVRPSNLSAIAMYESFGFYTDGRRRRYYSDNDEDALIMWRNREPEATISE